MFRVRIATTMVTMILIALKLHSQEITEVELALKKNINNFWSSKKSTLVIELHNIYHIPKDPIDTLRRVFLQIYNEGYETLGMTSGISIFSAGKLTGVGGSANKIEKLVKEQEFVYLEKEQFFKLLTGANSVYNYLKTVNIGINNRPFIAVFQDENIKIGGTLKPGPTEDKFQFYFKYNEATFRMSENEFIEVAKFMNQVRDSLNKP